MRRRRRRRSYMLGWPQVKRGDFLYPSVQEAAQLLCKTVFEENFFY